MSQLISINAMIAEPHVIDVDADSPEIIILQIILRDSGGILFRTTRTLKTDTDSSPVETAKEISDALVDLVISGLDTLDSMGRAEIERRRQLRRQQRIIEFQKKESPDDG